MFSFLQKNNRSTIRMQSSQENLRAFASWVTDESLLSSTLLVISLRRSDYIQILIGQEPVEITESIISNLQKHLPSTAHYVLLNSQCIVVGILENLNFQQLRQLSTQLLDALAMPIFTQGSTVHLRPTIGAACFPQDASNFSTLLQNAFIACEKAKKQQLSFANFVAADLEGPELLLEEVERALHTGKIEVWLQPQMRIHDKSCISAEALIRWPSEDALLITPMAIAEIAEHHGLITALTEFVLKQALKQMHELEKHGIVISVAVNMSASMLSETNLPDLITKVLNSWQIPAERLTIEITENFIMQNIDYSLQMMTTIRELGVHLSIDDFGTGYSSLAYLSRMPLNELKIDRQFIQRLMNSEGDRHIVRSVIDLAHQFKLRVVAEGVESMESLHSLAAMGCDYIQGYGYALPMTTTDFIRWWQNAHSS